jgi:phosphoglycerate dehydrogenase-like enzyme
MKKGAYLINCARGKIVNTNSIVEALEKGQLAGYAGDVWYPEPLQQIIHGGTCLIKQENYFSNT